SWTRATMAATTTAALAATTARSAEDVDIVGLVRDRWTEPSEILRGAAERVPRFGIDPERLLELAAAEDPVHPEIVQLPAERHDDGAAARLVRAAGVVEERVQVVGVEPRLREDAPRTERLLARDVDPVVGVVRYRPERRIGLAHDDRVREAGLAPQERREP